jgi:hypothetical protein
MPDWSVAFQLTVSISLESVVFLKQVAEKVHNDIHQVVPLSKVRICMRSQDNSSSKGAVLEAGLPCTKSGVHGVHYVENNDEGRGGGGFASSIISFSWTNYTNSDGAKSSAVDHGMQVLVI